MDRGLDYVFETARWDEITGAARQLARAGDKLRAILAADGYNAADLLHSTPGSVLALCHDAALAKRWAEAVERAFAQETDIVTVSSVVRALTTKQILGGLYGTPRSMIGVPGVHDYQERINRYYGLASPSTVPTPDAVAERRHFGEVVALLHSLMHAARESRQIVPFYEALSFAERCASCHVRPAESLDEDDSPACGVCLNKRAEGRPDQAQPIGLIWLGAANLPQTLEQQRTPLAYRRLCGELTDSLRSAIKPIPNVLTLSEGNGFVVLATPAAEAFEAATASLERIALHYGLKLPTTVCGAVALADARSARNPLLFREMHRALEALIGDVQRHAEGKGVVLDVRAVASDAASDPARKPFTLDEARQIVVGSAILREAELEGDPFPELPEQMARGAAGLYYTFERSKLPLTAQKCLQRVERAWEAGATLGPRYFAMLSAALLLAGQQ